MRGARGGYLAAAAAAAARSRATVQHVRIAILGPLEIENGGGRMIPRVSIACRIFQERMPVRG